MHICRQANGSQDPPELELALALAEAALEDEELALDDADDEALDDDPPPSEAPPSLLEAPSPLPPAPPLAGPSPPEFDVSPNGADSLEAQDQATAIAIANEAEDKMRAAGVIAGGTMPQLGPGAKPLRAAPPRSARDDTLRNVERVGQGRLLVKCARVVWNWKYDE